MHIRQLDRGETDIVLRNATRRWLRAAVIRLAELPEYPDGRVLVAEEGLEPRAVLGLRLNWMRGERGLTALIAVLAVDPDHAHRGIGSLLVRFAEGIARLNGFSCLCVDPPLEQWCGGRCWAALGYGDPGPELAKRLGSPAIGGPR
ncbi:MAG: GNAT family N-acetyltransferase [Thermoanaerobaculales bacterium]|jgi:GNAT superfamily N-acetyltransferase|nr:GNAT family N-acetyltransferase [Thermoanaerobaculales bacterium]